MTGEKVVKLNPVAKMLKERSKLELTEIQVAQIDSINIALTIEIAMFVSEIDSLRPRNNTPPGGTSGRGGRGPGGSQPRGDDGSGGLGSPLARLSTAVAQVKLRYDAAILSVSKVLTDQQRTKALELTKKDRSKMEEYTAPPGRGRGE